jgi:SPP1 family predicted phage head-tail adaptor
MEAGRLDRRVELQHRVLTRSATTGEEVVTYTTYATVWAGKRDIRGREVFTAQQVNSDITTMWQIRHRTDVVATDVLVHDGLQYNIVGIAEIGRREGLELQATAVRP